MITGPGLPERANVKARRNTSGILSADGTLNVHFATTNDETRGVDFQIRLPSGETVQVAARQVRLHEEGPCAVIAPRVFD